MSNDSRVYTSMGAGSVITAAFILSWGRARYLPDTLTKLAAYLFVLIMVLLAFVRQTQLLPLIAVLAGQRAMPAWARGRMNATVIMFSQGAIALGGIIYGAGAQTWGAATVLIAVAAVIPVLLLTVQF